MNKVMLMGRLAKDPNFAMTQSGKKICNFTVAVDKNGEGADFIYCRAWEKTADFVNQYFKKGKPIVIEGRLENREYTKQDGTKATATEVICERVNFTISDKQEQQPAQPQQNEIDMLASQLPF